MGRSELLVVFALVLGLAGCRSNKSHEALPTQTTLEAMPAANAPSQAPTPQSILKELFPNAPEKTQDVECFRSITPNMSMYAVVQKCGRPDEEVGSGLYVFVYHLRDGSTAGISTPELDRVAYLTFTNSKGKTSTIIGSK